MTTMGGAMNGAGTFNATSDSLSRVDRAATHGTREAGKDAGKATNTAKGDTNNAKDNTHSTASSANGAVSGGLLANASHDTSAVGTGATSATGVNSATESTGSSPSVRPIAPVGSIASTGALDFEVYLATDPNGPLPSADAAVASPQIARWVSKLSEYFGHAGLCVGTVTFRDLPAWARDRYAPAGQVDISGAAPGGTPPASQTPSGCDDLSQLFTVAVAPSKAVHLFFAEDLVDGSAASGLTVLGIDGSIPGPSGVPGTVNGGAILGLFNALGGERVRGACSSASSTGFACGTDLLAYVAAHEAGHWLGLYHTTEATGTNFDPLTDTLTNDDGDDTLSGGRRGKVGLTFSISRVGRVDKMVYAFQSGSDPLDRAAIAAISASNPFPPLPGQFKGDRIVLQLNFAYNMPKQ